MKMKVTITGEYELSDDLEERERSYGATDPRECSVIDQANDPDIMLSCLDDPQMTIEPVWPELRTQDLMIEITHNFEVGDRVLWVTHLPTGEAAAIRGKGSALEMKELVLKELAVKVGCHTPS